MTLEQQIKHQYIVKYFLKNGFSMPSNIYEIEKVVWDGCGISCNHPTHTKKEIHAKAKNLEWLYTSYKWIRK